MLQSYNKITYKMSQSCSLTFFFLLTLLIDDWPKHAFLVGIPQSELTTDDAVYSSLYDDTFQSKCLCVKFSFILARFSVFFVASQYLHLILP